jgi:thiol-disulfide isomerase/thioredoxin
MNSIAARVDWFHFFKDPWEVSVYEVGFRGALVGVRGTQLIRGIRRPRSMMDDMKTMRRLILTFGCSAMIGGLAGCGDATPQEDASAPNVIAATKLQPPIPSPRSTKPPPAAKPLKIGDPVPPIDIATFHVGEPVTEIVPGKVHVIEFWATWCAPCIRSMPHVTALQKKHGDDLIIIGVSRESSEKVETMLNRNNGGVAFRESIGYRLASDPDQSMYAQWFKAAGQRGIPSAFVVDKKGILRWIGHPTNMDGIIEQLLAEASPGG